MRPYGGGQGTAGQRRESRSGQRSRNPDDRHAPRPGAKMVRITVVKRRRGRGSGLVRQQHQPLDPSASSHMGLKDLVDVFLGLVRVPDALGIDHHRRPQLAPLQAAGGIDADVRLQAHLLGLRLSCSCAAAPTLAAQEPRLWPSGLRLVQRNMGTVEQLRITRFFPSLPMAFVIWFQKIFCICSEPWRLAGSHVFNMASGSMACRLALIRS